MPGPLRVVRRIPDPQPESHQFAEGVKTFVEGVNPIPMVDALGRALIPQFVGDAIGLNVPGKPVSGPANFVNNVLGASWEELKAAKEAYDAGDYVTASRHVLGATPMVGPVLSQAGGELQRGEVGKALGRTAAVGAQIAAPAALARAKSVTVPSPFRNRNPVERAAVEFAGREGIPVDAATATGNSFVGGIRALVDRSMGGSVVAGRARAKTVDALTDTGNRLSGRVHPTHVTPEQAGTAMRGAVEGQVNAANDAATAAYAKLRALEARREALIAKHGAVQAPATHSRPFTDVPLAVDVAAARAELRPIYDSLLREAELNVPMTGGKATALKALDGLMRGPDLAPLSVVDAALSELKAASRGADIPALRTRGQGISSRAVQALEKRVTEAATLNGPAAYRALMRGRLATRAKFGAAEVLEQLVDEPVQTFGQATWARDAGIAKLRDVARVAPQEMAQVGRAYLENLMERATSQGGFDQVKGIWAEWQRLGPETKRVLFRDQGLVKDLDNFFMLAKKMGETPNPSGSTLVAAQAGEALGWFTNFGLGASYSVGSTTLAALLRNPATVRLLSRGLTLRGSSAAAKTAWAAELAKAAQDHGIPMEVPQATEGEGSPLSVVGGQGAAPGTTPAAPPAAAAPPGDEEEFRQWYADMAQRQGLNPNPDAPGQAYDYRAAFRAGAQPDASGHWPSDFKLPGHPNEVVGGFNTRTGERVPGTPRAASVEELVRLGWDRKTAERLAATPEPPAAQAAPPTVGASLMGAGVPVQAQEEPGAPGAQTVADLMAAPPRGPLGNRQATMRAATDEERRRRFDPLDQMMLGAPNAQHAPLVNQQANRPLAGTTGTRQATMRGATTRERIGDQVQSLLGGLASGAGTVTDKIGLTDFAGMARGEPEAFLSMLPLPGAAAGTKAITAAEKTAAKVAAGIAKAEARAQAAAVRAEAKAVKQAEQAAKVNEKIRVILPDTALPFKDMPIEDAKAFLKTHARRLRREKKLGPEGTEVDRYVREMKDSPLYAPPRGSLAKTLVRGPLGESEGIYSLQDNVIERLRDIYTIGTGLPTTENWAGSASEDLVRAFGGDRDLALQWARMWGATSPNTSVSVNTRESISALIHALENPGGTIDKASGLWIPNAKFDIEMAQNLPNAKITMAASKVPNLNNALTGAPLSGDKVEAMAAFMAGHSRIPIDVHALYALGATLGEGKLGPELKQLRRFMAHQEGVELRGSFTKTDLYKRYESAFIRALQEIAPGRNVREIFADLWVGARTHKGLKPQGGPIDILRKKGLLEYGALLDPARLRAALAQDGWTTRGIKGLFLALGLGAGAEATSANDGEAGGTGVKQ